MMEFHDAIEEEAKESGKKKLSLVIATPQAVDNIRGTAPQDLVPYVDFFNMMTYAYYSGWVHEFTSVCAPLVRSKCIYTLNSLQYTV